MEVFKCFPFGTFCFGFTLLLVVHAQDQSGFISIDCGIPEGSSYSDETTGLVYVSDSSFIDTGENAKISPEINETLYDRQYRNLRSFPEGDKNCYSLTPAKGKNNTYLIRAGFLYGNYDNKSDVPRFDLYLGGDWWVSVTLPYAFAAYYEEIIYVPSSDYIDVCLVNVGFGTPFISVLELRELENGIYATDSGALQLWGRVDCGLTTSDSIRFPSDSYDRIWSSFTYTQWQNLSASPAVTSINESNFRVPSSVMRTAIMSLNDSPAIGFSITLDSSTTEFYVHMHFAEIEQLNQSQSREFNIYVNQTLWRGPITPKYLQTTTVSSISPEKGRSFDFRVNKTLNSTNQPILNAAEVFLVREFSQSETYQPDVDAIMNIKSTYNVMKYWKGDPCLPEITVWSGLNCSYGDPKAPRIISLNLSSRGLTGTIASSISKLTMLEYLDLSNNSLTGPIPDFLSQLPYLRVLDLSRNHLSGPVPLSLIEKSKKGLSLSTRQNKNTCSTNLCKHKFIVPLVATVAAVLVLLLIVLSMVWRSKRRRQGSPRLYGRILSSKERRFDFSVVTSITNNFERIIGRGNFGTVYHGYMDEASVAVKILSPTCLNGYLQFRADARLITSVHHRHLVSSLGYFEEGDDKGFMFEFVPNGSLEDILSGKSKHLLSWQERLHIAMDVAQGLDFLHNSCRPSIIHGNLKPTNILLNENFQAKLIDFGLSKIYTVENGTPEYLDPEFHVTNKLTERSDVYSFGVLLLSVITNQPATPENRDGTSVTQRVNSLVKKGDIRSLVDPRLRGDFHKDSVWKAVEIAVNCASPISVKRPSISQVVMDLNQCLAMEVSRVSRETGTIEMVTVNLSTSKVPQPR